MPHKPSLSDAAILEALQAGGAARERMSDYLFGAYQGYLRKCRGKYRLNEGQARDAYTDALISLLRQIDSRKFRGESQLGTYFFRILQSKCVDQLRRTASNPVEAESLFPELEVPAQDFLGQMVSRDQVRQVREVLAGLGERCQQLILLADYWGYKPQEIAERMGLASASSATSQKHKCMQRLRKRLHALSSKN